MATCPICFEDLDGKVKASPDICDHVFCLPCIEKWAKLGSFCPVDRKRFRKLVNLESEAIIQVKPKKRKRKKTVYDFSSECEICLKGDDAEVLLLCDCCDLGFHLYCLKPPLKRVPTGLWFCPTCISIESKIKKQKGITKELDADLGNATLQLEKIKKDCDVKKILTQDKKQNSEEVSISKQADVKKFNDTKTLNKEQCCSSAVVCFKGAFEFKDINVEKNCSEDDSCSLKIGAEPNKSEAENSSKCKKNVNCKHEKYNKKYSPVQSEIYQNTGLQYPNFKINETLEDDDLSKDCLSQAIFYGDMKILREENENTLDKPCYAPLHDVGFRKTQGFSSLSQSHSTEIVSNENSFQQSNSNISNFSKHWMQQNAGHEDASSMNISSPSSSISAELHKDRNISKARSNDRFNTHFCQNKDNILNITVESIGPHKINCAIKSHRCLKSQNNYFYFNFCQSESLKQKVNSNDCINEMFSVSYKSGKETSLFNACKQENEPESDGEDNSNFTSNNFGCSKASTKEKSETLTRSNYDAISSDKEISSFGHDDLKYLTIRSDGSFYIDLPDCKNTKTENHQWGVSKEISESQENINFTSNSPKCTDVKNDNLTYLDFSENFIKKENIHQPNAKTTFEHFKENTTTADDKPTPDQLIKHEYLYSFNKNEISECLNSQHIKIENNNSKNYLTHDKGKTDEDIFQNSGSADSEDSSKTVSYSDLKYLKLRKDGTFVLDIPSSEEGEKSVQKSNSTSNCKTLCYTDLKHLNIRSDGTFFLDIPH